MGKRHAPVYSRYQASGHRFVIDWSKFAKPFGPSIVEVPALFVTLLTCKCGQFSKLVEDSTAHQLFLKHCAHPTDERYRARG